MVEPSVLNSNDGLDCSWFVEGMTHKKKTWPFSVLPTAFATHCVLRTFADINLFNTTIRYAGTNEVATLSNGSIAHMRIVNGNRSPHALVWFQLPYKLNVLEEEKMGALKAFLEGYAKLHPDKWHSCSYCRADLFEPDIEKVVISIGFQARCSWQDLVGLYFMKSDLMAATIAYGRQIGINYEELPQRHFQYNAGKLRRGGVWKHRAQLHGASNILSADEQVNGASGSDPHEQETPRAHSNLTRDEEPLHDDGGGRTQLVADALFLSRLQGSH